MKILYCVRSERVNCFNAFDTDIEPCHWKINKLLLGGLHVDLICAGVIAYPAEFASDLISLGINAKEFDFEVGDRVTTDREHGCRKSFNIPNTLNCELLRRDNPIYFG